MQAQRQSLEKKPAWQVYMDRDYLPKGDRETKGTWTPVVEEIDGRRLVVGAWVRCPRCGFERALHHEILNTGEVNPIFACPSKACEYRDHIQLDEWTGGNLPSSTE